jgi:hypothetical protein
MVRPAQLADQRAVVEPVHALAHERRAAAVLADRSPRLEGTDALAQELTLEVAFGDAAAGRLPPAVSRSSHTR